MIDWYSVGFGALWILGLSIGLAAVSFANYRSGMEKRKLWQVLGRSNLEFVLDLAVMFFCMGLVGSADAIWERIVWAVLALMFAVQTWQARKMSNG